MECPIAGALADNIAGESDTTKAALYDFFSGAREVRATVVAKVAYP